MNNMNPLPSVKRSIFSEFMILITIIIVTFSLLIGWYLFNNFNELTQQQYIKSLETLAEAKSSTINQYIDDHGHRVETLAMLPVTKLALPEFNAIFQQGGTTSAAYQRTNLNYSGFFENYLSHWNYYDIFLIDVAGNIVYSVKHESDFGTNLQTGSYRQTGLGQVFQQSVEMLQTNNSTFAYYEPSQEAGAFIATPVMSNGRLIGVIALQFDTDTFYHVLNNLIGLGKTGEIVTGKVVNQEILITAPLRHDPNAAFQRKIKLDASHALPIIEGSQGISGSGIIIDWRGEEAVAVWQYIPSLQWGMVVKIDTSEAFSDWQAIENTLIVYTGLGLLITYCLLFLFARRITRPLRKLTQVSMDFGSSKQNTQLDSLIESHNEVGTLATAFNQMMNRVHHSETELQDTIEELAKNNRVLDQRVTEKIEHIRAIIEHATDGIITMDQQGIIQSVNPAISEMFAYSEEQLVGQAMSKIIPTVFSDKDPQNVSTEVDAISQSGTSFPIDLRVINMQVAGGNLFLATIRDMSQANLERSKLEHTQRLESLGVLAGGIAHDFNNLLTTILGNASLAKTRMDKTSPALRMISNIENASERAAALCRQMLAYSGKGKFIVEPINMTDMIQEMMSLLQVSIQKNVVMRLDLSEQLLPIEADASQMQQVIMNLVINASEAIENKSGSITIHTSVVDIDHNYLQTTYMNDDLALGRYVAIEVSDTGCGMDENTKKHLFDPFFTTKFTGRGLGMSAILGIVRGHKGAIKLYSEIGKGTTFKILFPCSETAEVKQKESPSNHLVQKGSGTILIVDDEETIRAVAGMMLEEIGFTILNAKDGVEGVDVFREHHADIRAVLLDMTMPRMNGEEVFREIRAIQANVKVVLSSGYNEQDATNRFAGKGLAGFIQKPYSPSALQAKILGILDDDSGKL